MAVTCSYELHVKTAKEELVKKIKSLEDAVEALQSELKEKEMWIEALQEVFSPGSHGLSALQQQQRKITKVTIWSNYSHLLLQIPDTYLMSYFEISIPRTP